MYCRVRPCLHLPRNASVPGLNTKESNPEISVKKGRISPCKWYYCCPVRTYTEQGKLERYWIDNYCLAGNKGCIRYQMEEKGEYHPNNMLPNGEIREDLR